MQHEFEHGGARYRFIGMSAQVKLRCLRRLSPLIAPVVPIFLRRGTKPGSHFEVRRDIDVGTLSPNSSISCFWEA